MSIGAKESAEALCFPAVQSSVNTHHEWRDISLLSGRVSIKLATNIHHYSRQC